MTSPAPDDPTAATTRAIATANLPGPPDPSAATIRAIATAAGNHQQLVAVQLEVLAERIKAVATEALARRAAVLAGVTQRLDSMDKANDLLAADLRKVPTDLQVAITSVKELEAVKFNNIGERFDQLERQTAREKATADLALGAAFSAADKAAAATNAANAEAIHKSELATSDTIRTNAEAQRAGQQSLSDKIDDTKDRMNRLESLIIAIQTERSTQHDTKTDARGTINLGLATVTIILAIISTVAVVWGLSGR